MKNVLPLFALIALAFSAPGAHAATITVTTTADTGAGSLRAAIAAAAAGDTIQFAAALNGQTITLTSAQLSIDKDLIIQGPGANQLTVKRSTAGGTPAFRIFSVASSHTVTIDGITISNGRAQSPFPGSAGAGIYNDGSVLTIANCIINGNSAAYGGGGIFNDATNSGSAQLTIRNSTLSGNAAASRGAAIYNYGYGDFNPFSVFASVEMSDSTISGNSAVSGAGIYTDGSFDGNAFLTITSSTFSGNTASDSGGGIYNDGEEVESGNAYVSILNTTFSGNSAGLGGAIMDDGMEQGLAVLGIGNCTFSDNSAGVGGGVYIKTPFSGSGYAIGHTILKAGASGENIHVESGPGSSAGYNLSSDDGSGVLTAVGDQINTNPMIGPLQDNGGPTFTHALLLGSTGINAGSPTYSPPPDFDQRGTGFPRIFNTRIDIGSFEYQMVAPIPTPSPIPTASPTPTATATPTPTASPTPIHTPTPTPIASPTPAHTPTPTATPIVSPTPVHTPTPTATPITSPIPTPTPTATAAATPTPPPSPTPGTILLNISTRLRVLTEDNALIGGFIVTGNVPKRVIVRAIGPSLTNLGIPGALADPVLELHGPGGFATVSNNNWRDTQEAEIEATGVAPSNDLESAIVATLPPGAYTAIVSGNSGGTGVGVVEAYDLAPAAGAQLANISTRGFVDSGDNVMIGGFILGSGNANAKVLIRGIGPSLAAAGVPNALIDPTLELHNANGFTIAANDDWREAQQAEIEATGIPPGDDRESAIIGTLPPGAYTAILRGKDDATGVALVEAYQLSSPTATPIPTPPATPTPTPIATPTPTATVPPTPTPTPTPTPSNPARFGSLSSKAVVGTGDAIVLNAFIITGPDTKRVIVRGLGPSLGVAGELADPALDLRTSTGALIATNDNWRDAQEAEIIATGMPPTNDLEAAIVATLSPGSYTVVLRGVNNTTGVGVNDLHDLSPAAASALTAVGTRANVLLGNDALFSEIVLQGNDFLIRALGPSLADAGVATALANPVLELHGPAGFITIINDNWRDTQETEVIATGIPPTNNLESAQVATLPPNSYTTIVRGNGTIRTGIGYVQFYSLPHSGPELKLTP